MCVPWGGPIWGVSDALFMGLLPLIGVRPKSGFPSGALFGGRGPGGSKRGEKKCAKNDQKSVPKCDQKWGCENSYISSLFHFSVVHFLVQLLCTNLWGQNFSTFFQKNVTHYYFYLTFGTQVGGCDGGPIGGFPTP